MDLKVKCEAKVELKNFFNLIDVQCMTHDYHFDNDTLTGNVEVVGRYNQSDMTIDYEFKDTVPYTIVFKDKNYCIDEIKVTDLTYNEIVNLGLECSFSININYHQEEKNNDVVDDTPLSIQTEEVEVIQGEVNCPEAVEIEQSNVDADETVENEADIENVQSDIKQEIEEKYDNLLNQILDSRDDNFLDNVNVSESSSSEVNLNKIGEKYDSYRVYYPSKESELEKIATVEKISVDNIYKNNTDFASKKRIIIK